MRLNDRPRHFQLNLIDCDQFQRLEKHLARVMNRIADDATVPELAAMLTQFVMAGGKRIRPQLCLWTYLQSQGQGHDAAVLDLACAWELFHAFLLVHDDIIDQAEVRRDQVSLHRQLASLDSNCPVFGQNLGIVAGDLLYTAAVRVFHEVDLPHEMYRRQLMTFSRVASVTGFGQAVDIFQSHVPLDCVCEKTLLRGYHWKTAAYTFEGPMMSGGICAGLNDQALAAISQFSTALGQAYQLQNDLLDLHQPAHEGCDILQGKRTLILVRGRLSMADNHRREFDDLMALLSSAAEQGVPIAESLRLRLLATDAPCQIRDLISRLLSQAQDATTSSALPPALSTGMHDLLQTLSDKYFVRV